MVLNYFKYCFLFFVAGAATREGIGNGT
jgi:hypothetical protein